MADYDEPVPPLVGDPADEIVRHGRERDTCTVVVVTETLQGWGPYLVACLRELSDNAVPRPTTLPTSMNQDDAHSGTPLFTDGGFRRMDSHST